MESYGANCIYVVDSGGAEYGRRARLIPGVEKCSRPPCEDGYPCPPQPELGRCQLHRRGGQGCDRVDASVAGMGAGAGNTPLEVFIAAAEQLG